MDGLAATLISECKAHGLTLAVAESCTGGMISAAITDVPGSSAVFDRGFITYSNESKCELLGVAPALIEAHGAVSEQVATAMVQGAVKYADLAVAVTGIAGPTGGSAEKPVGLVYIAVAMREGETQCETLHFTGSRAEVRQAACEKALEMLTNLACQQ